MTITERIGLAIFVVFLVLIFFVLVDLGTGFEMSYFFKKMFRKLFSFFIDFKDYKYAMSRESYIRQKENWRWERTKKLSEYPIFSYKSFKDFYNLNPASWDLYEYFAVKNKDTSLIMVFSYKDWRQYNKFRKALEKEEANRQANKEIKEKLEFQNEITQKIIEAVQADIDATREEAQRNFDEATQLIKGTPLYSSLKKKNLKTIEIYEYGNGVLVPPFWDRVQAKIDKVKEEYEIVDEERKFIPAHDNYGDELYLTLFCKDKE